MCLENFHEENWKRQKFKFFYHKHLNDFNKRKGYKYILGLSYKFHFLTVKIIFKQKCSLFFSYNNLQIAYLKKLNFPWFLSFLKAGEGQESKETQPNP